MGSDPPTIGPNGKKPTRVPRVVGAVLTGLAIGAAVVYSCSMAIERWRLRNKLRL